MIELKISTATTLTTVQVYAPGANLTLEFQHCLYCGENLVQLPQKFCRPAHRVAYCEKRLGRLMSDVSRQPCTPVSTTA